MVMVGWKRQQWRWMASRWQQEWAAIRHPDDPGIMM
jgi:hypothetical protein